MHFLLSVVLSLGQAAPPPTPYLKTTTEANGVFSLQTGAHRLTAPGKPDVWLVGAAHIGTKHYYEALQKLLDGQAEVLFEGVKSSPKSDTKPAPPPNAGPPPKSIYQVLSDALGLDFQLTDINYRRGIESGTWINSDLSMDELDKLNKKASGGKANTFSMLESMLDPNSPTAQMFAGAIKTLTPGALEGLKLFFIQKLSTLDPSAILGDAATAEVVLKARNESVEATFAKVVATPTPPTSVAIFYGALHQQDLESALTKVYGYKLAESRWFTAATADTNKVDAQGHMIYGMLESQLSPPKGAAGK